MCPSHSGASSSPAQGDLLLALFRSLCLSSIWAAPNTFQSRSLYHTDTVTYQEYKHTDSHSYTHYSAFNPSHDVQINQQFEPEACRPSGQPFPAGSQHATREKPLIPILPENQRVLIVSLSPGQGRRVQLYHTAAKVIKIFNLSLSIFTHCLSRTNPHTFRFFSHSQSSHFLRKSDCTKSRGKGSLCRHSRWCTELHSD